VLLFSVPIKLFISVLPAVIVLLLAVVTSACVPPFYKWAYTSTVNKAISLGIAHDILYCADTKTLFVGSMCKI
jgi:hypothetical protein